MRIHIHVGRQILQLITATGIQQWPVSTAEKGLGEQKGSYCTPRGAHVIRARIGGDCPINTVFVARRPTGEIYTPELGWAEPGRDWILTRILWLSGREVGFNRLGNCDTLQRYIYIHGTPDELFEPKPLSHGCIRMRNADLVTLFDQAPAGTPVLITEE